MAKKTDATTNGNGAEGPLKTLKSVYDFMIQNGLDSVEIVEDGATVKLVRRKANVQQVAVPVPVATGGIHAPVAPAAAPSGAASQHSAPAPVPTPAGTAVKSPMMGIFYRAPSPSSPPFCKEGDVVKPGHVICMIEAMKVFNEMKAEFPCTIVKYLVENGKPVKSGQDLIIVAR
ncbi:MAG: acetyl-CoA carboxylase biotin carboxyl carrier protein [Elusimicrobiota bacterium]|nr:acetyl-CoA carboxylase biotin carboxyl carrier protein [Elusimicrobiota bacterium]